MTRPKRIHASFSTEEKKAVEAIKKEVGLASEADVIRIALHDLFRKKKIKIENTD